MYIKKIHVLVITVCLWVFACASESRSSKYSNFKTTEDANYENELDNDGYLDSYSYKIEATPFKETLLIHEKLEDFYDLLTLRNRHPEFSEDVTLQLKNFTNDSLNLYAIKGVKTVQNMRPIGNIKIIDSTKRKVQYTYDIVSETSRKTDTIWVIITSKMVVLDGKSVLSNKVKFSKH